MFHRAPLISPAAVLTTALVILVGVLLALSLSPPSTAHADHGGPPKVKIKAVMPEVGEEGSDVTVTLKLSRPLTADEKYCYSGSTRTSEVCIQGGIIVWDTSDDHLYEEGGSKYDNGHIPSNELVKFVFRGSEKEKRLLVRVKDDQCITPGREIRIAINTAFDEVDDYGYTIDSKEFRVPVNGNDDTNGEGDCEAVEPGVTEEADYNKAPTFDDSENPPEFSVDENTEAGQDVGYPVTASDPENDTLTYSLKGQDGASFTIDPSSGQIQTKDTLDHETKDTYHVAVFVRDSKNIHGDSDTTYDNSIDVTINVNDVNEPPEFDSGVPAALNVVENTPPGEDIGSPITATDPDTDDTLTYSLDDDDGAAFEIDADGQIQTKEALDHETKGSYSLTVTATDSGDNTATHPVTITVTDEEHEPPRFEEEYGDGESSLTREVAENTEPGQPVGAPVSATDDDSDPLTYSLDDQDGAKFEIDSSGQIKTKDALDYEDTPSFNVTVSVTDGEDDAGNAEPDPPTIDDTIDVTIDVTDVNEPPAFDDGLSTAESVAENTGTDTPIGSPFTATDPDTTSDTLTYSLAGADAASFDIDETTGQLKTKADLNHETKETYGITVSVSDGRDNEGAAEIPPVADTTIDVTIAVTDVDEEGTITFSSDNPAAGTTLTATLDDDDTPISDETWVWEISDDQSTWGVIDGETTSSYTPGSDDVDDYLRVTVTYTDSFSSSKTVTEDTAQVATAPPTNQNPKFADDAVTTLSVAENTPAGQNIGDPYTATQADSKGTLVYSLDTTGATNFDIDSPTGQLKTKTALDYETTTSYNVTISVTDGLDDYSSADTAADDTITVTINVINIEVPDVPAAPTVTATPGAAAGMTVTWTAVTATDTKPVDGYDLQYREKDATPEATWTELSVTTNSATITTGLDYEKTYEVQVRSKNSEGGSGWSPSGERAIPSKLDVSFSSSSYTVTEGSSETITVNVSPAADRALDIPITVAAGTAESGDYTVTGLTGGKLSITSSSGSATFTISANDDSDRNDETVSLAFGSLPPAVGTASPSTATLTIDDTTPAPRTPNNGGGGGGGNNGGNNGGGGGNKGGGSFTPSYTPPPANQAPTFNDGTSTERWVAEKSPEGTDIGHPVRATDADKDSLTFSLGGTDASSFSIVTGTGQLKTKAELDFEIRDTYSVTVSVTDGQGGTDSIAVTIRVTDVVDVPVTDEDHQVVALVDPDDETEVSTPGGDATVTFPEDTRPGPFFVLIDTSEGNCDWDSLDDPPADELQACVTVEVYDTQGNPITGDDIFDPAITIEVVLDPDDIGTDTIHSFVESGNGWTSVTFTQSTDSDGNITITIGGVTGPGTYGVGSNAVQQLRSTVIPEEPKQSEQQATVQIPPTPEPTPQPTPEPTPQPTPEPTPQPRRNPRRSRRRNPRRSRRRNPRRSRRRNPRRSQHRSPRRNPRRSRRRSRTRRRSHSRYRSRHRSRWRPRRRRSRTRKFCSSRCGWHPRISSISATHPVRTCPRSRSSETPVTTS